MAQIERVRLFNRVVTRRAGALDDSYLRRGRPLGEARVLYETGPRGADVRTLRTRLGLDTGYLSRLLRSLETQGLIAVSRRADDARARCVQLTARGRREFAAYDKLSDRLACSLLEPLDPQQRERLIAAMEAVTRLIRAASLEVRMEDPGSDDARWCLGQYFREIAERFDAGFDPVRGGASDDAAMQPPSGCFVVARLDGEPAGCGGMKRLDATTGEIKRVWTAPSARGQGVARRIMQDLEARAAASGVKTVRLDTNKSLTEAQAMYGRSGYTEIARYNDNPYAHRWFEKKLVP